MTCQGWPQAPFPRAPPSSVCGLVFAVSQLADRGLATRNELREILNLTPLPAPYGDQIPARGEYYDVTNPPEDKEPANDNGGESNE